MKWIVCIWTLKWQSYDNWFFFKWCWRWTYDIEIWLKDEYFLLWISTMEFLTDKRPWKSMSRSNITIYICSFDFNYCTSKLRLKMLKSNIHSQLLVNATITSAYLHSCPCFQKKHLHVGCKFWRRTNIFLLLHDCLTQLVRDNWTHWGLVRLISMG